MVHVGAKCESEIITMSTFKGNTFFDLDLGIKVTLKLAQRPLYHVTYSHAKF